MPPHFNFSPGEILYKYQLQSKIGDGGFGDVWLAHDHSVDRDIAVKVLDASSVSIDERLHEAKVGNHLDHQNLVTMHYADIITHNTKNIVIIAMDYHPNGSIIRRLNAGNFMPLPAVIRFMIDILRGLEYLHELDIFHSDIKPQNILIGAANQGVLTDYGISCHSPLGQPVQPRSAYKLHIAPEVLNNNQIDVQTDIYQVGLTAFRLLNGIGTIRDKFNSVGESEYNKLVLQGRVVLADDYLPFIPRNLKRIINKAISVDPANRYQSAVEMRRALERLSYPGYWTCDAGGELVGYNNGNEFRFEEIAIGSNRYRFTAFKKLGSSGRETRISAFTSSNLSRKQVNEMKRDFLMWLVTGR